MNQNKAQANTKLVNRHMGGLVAAYPTVSSSFLDKTYGNSLPTTRFEEILLQPITCPVNRPSTCTFSHMTFLMSHVTF